MPTTQDYVGLHPHGQPDVDTFNRVLQSTAQTHGAAFLNLGVWPNEQFADEGHVNGAGSDRFMIELNTELAKLGWT